MSKNKYRTIRQILKDAGERRIALESNKTRKPVGVEAVYKWRFLGVPAIHQGLVMRLAGATAEEFMTANIVCQETRGQEAA